MQSLEIMQAQIESAMAGLARIREQLAAADEPDRIGHELEWALSHLEDIRHHWAALRPSQAAAKPRRNARSGWPMLASQQP